MTRGRKPLPQELLNLRGTNRPCRQRPSSTIGEPIKLSEIQYRCQVSGLRSVPARAREIYWAQVKKVAAQGMLDEMFCQQLFFYSVEYDFFLSCCESIRDEGPIIIIKDANGDYLKKDNGDIIAFPNPAVKHREKALEKLIKIGSNYGFTPVDRLRLKAPVEEKGSKVKGIFAMLMADDEQPDEQ